MKVDHSRCPVPGCGEELKRFEERGRKADKIYKCHGGHALALELKSNHRPLRDGEQEDFIWVCLIDDKEYPTAKMP